MRHLCRFWKEYAKLAVLKYLKGRNVWFFNFLIMTVEDLSTISGLELFAERICESRVLRETIKNDSKTRKDIELRLTECGIPLIIGCMDIKSVSIYFSLTNCNIFSKTICSEGIIHEVINGHLLRDYPFQVFTWLSEYCKYHVLCESDAHSAISFALKIIIGFPIFKSEPTPVSATIRETSHHIVAKAVDFVVEIFTDHEFSRQLILEEILIAKYPLNQLPKHRLNSDTSVSYLAATVLRMFQGFFSSFELRAYDELICARNQCEDMLDGFIGRFVEASCSDQSNTTCTVISDFHNCLSFIEFPAAELVCKSILIHSDRLSKNLEFPRRESALEIYCSSVVSQSIHCERLKINNCGYCFGAISVKESVGCDNCNLSKFHGNCIPPGEDYICADCSLNRLAAIRANDISFRSLKPNNIEQSLIFLICINMNQTARKFWLCNWMSSAVNSEEDHTEPLGDIKSALSPKNQHEFFTELWNISDTVLGNSGSLFHMQRKLLVWARSLKKSSILEYHILNMCGHARSAKRPALRRIALKGLAEIMKNPILRESEVTDNLKDMFKTDHALVVDCVLDAAQACITFEGSAQVRLAAASLTATVTNRRHSFDLFHRGVSILTNRIPNECSVGVKKIICKSLADTWNFLDTDWSLTISIAMIDELIFLIDEPSLVSEILKCIGNYWIKRADTFEKATAACRVFDSLRAKFPEGMKEIVNMISHSDFKTFSGFSSRVFEHVISLRITDRSENDESMTNSQMVLLSGLEAISEFSTTVMFSLTRTIITFTNDLVFVEYHGKRLLIKLLTILLNITKSKNSESGLVILSDEFRLLQDGILLPVIAKEGSAIVRLASLLLCFIVKHITKDFESAKLLLDKHIAAIECGEQRMIPRSAWIVCTLCEKLGEVLLPKGDIAKVFETILEIVYSSNQCDHQVSDVTGALIVAMSYLANCNESIITDPRFSGILKSSLRSETVKTRCLEAIEYLIDNSLLESESSNTSQSLATLYPDIIQASLQSFIANKPSTVISGVRCIRGLMSSGLVCVSQSLSTLLGVSLFSDGTEGDLARRLLFAAVEKNHSQVSKKLKEFFNICGQMPYSHVNLRVWIELVERLTKRKVKGSISKAQIFELLISSMTQSENPNQCVILCTLAMTCFSGDQDLQRINSYCETEMTSFVSRTPLDDLEIREFFLFRAATVFFTLRALSDRLRIVWQCSESTIIYPCVSQNGK